MNKEQIKQKIKSSVLSAEPGATIILFGSKARGTDTADSDWDILILLDKNQVSFKDEQKLRHRLFEVELEADEAISTFVYSLQDWNTRMTVTPLYKNIVSEGVTL